METPMVMGVIQLIAYFFVKLPNGELQVVLPRAFALGNGVHTGDLIPTLEGRVRLNEQPRNCLFRLIAEKDTSNSVRVNQFQVFFLANSFGGDNGNNFNYGVVITSEVFRLLFPEHNAVNTCYLGKERIAEILPHLQDPSLTPAENALYMDPEEIMVLEHAFDCLPGLIRK
jgi:hypothetical protein